MRTLILLLTLLTALCLPARTQADDTTNVARRTVSLVTLDDYAPFCFAKPGHTNNGREVIAPGADSNYLQGYTWDVVREAFHAQRYYIILDSVPWTYAEAAARANTAASTPGASKEHNNYSLSLRFGDSEVLTNREKQKKPQNLSADLLFPTINTTARSAIFDFSVQPVDMITSVLYLPANSSLQFSGPESLAGKRIGMVKGWFYGADIDNTQTVNKIALDDMDTGFRLLRQGRLDALAGYKEVFDRQLKHIRWDKFFKTVTTGIVLNEYLCGRKSATRTKELLHAYAAGLEAISKNGQLNAIARKWKITSATGGN